MGKQIPEKQASGSVYFVRAAGTDFVKIGFTSRPIEKHLEELQPFCPHALECVVYGAGTLESERAVHMKLRKYQHHHEWFYITPETATRLLAEYYGLITEEQMEAAEARLLAKQDKPYETNT